jgi:ABC-type phosphate transport system substrate-binding protein
MLGVSAGDAIALALGTAGLTGVFSLTATFLTARNADTRAKQDRSDSRIAATEERQQRRVEGAYLAMMQLLQRGVIRVQSVRPVHRTGPPPDNARQVTHDESVLVKAQLSICGSTEIEVLYQNWWQAYNTFHLKAVSLDVMAGGEGLYPADGGWTEQWKTVTAEMEVSRSAVLALSKDIATQAKEELRSSSVEAR